MTPEIEQTVRDAILRNLPAQVGEVLQGELQRLKTLEETSAHQAETILARDTEIRRLNSIVSDQGTKLQQHGILENREKAVALREHKMDLIDKDLACAELRRTDMFNVMGLIFRSPVTREIIAGTIPVPVAGMPAGGSYNNPSPGFVSPSPISTEKTTITE